MALHNFIDMKVINPLRSLPMYLYYFAKKSYKPLNSEDRAHHIVVSLTSFPARFGTLHFAIKSILNQKLRPDVVLLCLAKNEAKDESELPSSVLELKKYGVRIFFADDNLKPHNKYYHAMKLYPDSLIVTVDDDNIYDKNLVSALYASYLKYPCAVSARRVHKIVRDKGDSVLPYNKWRYEYKKVTTPSFNLLATGVGGVLYPPRTLPPEAFDVARIRELCLNADDIWLKFMELKNNIPVVWVKGRKVHPLGVRKTQGITLQKANYHEKLNDAYINGLQDHYKIDLVSYLGGK